MKDTWQALADGVQSLADLLQTCRDAFVDDEAAPKVSATTKKRLSARALQGLQGGFELVQALRDNVHSLREAAQQQDLELQQACNSNQSLQQQLHAAKEECQSSKRALLQSGSQTLTQQEHVAQLQKQLQESAAQRHELEATISDLQAELRCAAQQASDARSHLQQLQKQVDLLAAAAREAEEGADAAAGALQEARGQAEKERAARARHEDAVARLTADNLVFMSRLRAAEAGAAAATAERDELRLALEEHKGPWMDEVHRGVEARVKAALAHAEELEAQQQLAAAQHAQHSLELQQQQADLEAALHAARQQVAQLQEQLMAAQTAASEARTAAEEAAVLAGVAQAAADERGAELRVAQDSLRAMREECNERWASERSARAQLAELQGEAAAREESQAKLKRQLQARSDDLAVQKAVNQQLMLKKEEVEWQLLAALAQAHGTHLAALTHTGPESTHSISPQPSLDMKHQHHTMLPTPPAAATPPAPPASALATEEDSLPSPFGASAQLPLSPVQPAPPPATQQQQQQQQPRLELPGPAAVAACGGLWQLPGGSSSGLFGSRGSSSGNGAAALGLLMNPMPAGTSAAVSALLGSRGSLHHAFSAPEGDMYTLPRLGMGLAALPSPEQLLAAAAASVAASGSGSGGLQKTVTIGRAGSLTVPVSSSTAAAHPAGPAGCDGAGLPPAAANSSAAASGGGSGIAAGGSLTLRPPLQVQPIMLAPTGGLMAPFSPLSPISKGPSGTSRGVVFPECITASAVTDAEQGDLGCFSFAQGLPDAMQQQAQQQVLGPGFWYLQQQQAQQQQQPQQQQTKHRQGSSGSLSDGGHGVHHSSSLCASSSSLHGSPLEHPTQQATNRHDSNAPPGPAAQASDQAAAAAAAAAAADGSSSDSNNRHSNDSSSSGGSNGHLHGILLNGPHSRSRSPANGVSPSGSMKSVRFSFEGLDNAHSAGGADVEQEQQPDQKGGRRGSSGSVGRLSLSPTSRSHGRGGSEWLRHTLYEQLSSQSPTAGHGLGHSPGSASRQLHHHISHEGQGYHHDPHGRRRRSNDSGSREGAFGRSSSGRQLHGWGVSSHPPAHAPRGMHYMGRFAEQRGSAHEERLRQLQRQQRQQEAAKEVAALTAAAAGDGSAPRRAPVHPIFGTVQLPPAAAGGGSGGGGDGGSR